MLEIILVANLCTSLLRLRELTISKAPRNLTSVRSVSVKAPEDVMIWKKSLIKAYRASRLISKSVSFITLLNMMLLGFSASARVKPLPSTSQVNPS